MSDDYIEVRSGGSDIPDGVYTVVLTKISDIRTVTATRGPKAGKDVDLMDWTFSVDEPGNQFDGEEITDSTSTATGNKSKMYAWLTALHGGVAPEVGQRFAKSALIGRSALATIRKDDNGWPKIENLGAIPAALRRQQAAPAAPPPAPTQQPVAAATASDDLPF